MMVGQAIGPYSIIAKLGEGGMGEVYRAIDSNLKRAAAIKVLPASVAGDADRLARFQREAEALAALNHPNIGAIYGLEKTPDFTALVMELIQGDDLTSRIARGAIPIDEALPIAKQIADALEAAHEQNIIHRDLKPANIKVRDDGTVKVLDFGLAKAMDPPGSSSMDDALAHAECACDDAGRHPRDRGVHGAGTSARQSRRSPRRRLGVRCRALRDADGHAGLRGGRHYDLARVCAQGRGAVGCAAGRCPRADPAAPAALPGKGSEAPAERDRRRASRIGRRWFGSG
jgi:serine/threonine protein kinase